MLVGANFLWASVALRTKSTFDRDVCGLAWLSPRFIAAALTFMAATAVTGFVVRHVPGG